MNIAAFLSYVVLTAFTPGPNNILAMSTATRYGFRKTIPLCLGMLAGFFLVIGSCALFSSLLYNFIPSVEPVMRILGAAYILYLAWTIFRSKSDSDDSASDTPVGFIAGCFLQCINVKIILYGLTAMSTFILPHYSRPFEIVLFTLFLIFASTTSNLLWAFFGSAFQKLFSQYAKALNTIMALLLVYCALTLLW